MNQRNIESLTPEVKIIGEYTLNDIFIMLLIGLLFYMLSPAVYQPLQPFYIVFCIFISFWSIKRNRMNPDKRRYQVIWLILKRDKNYYHMLEEEGVLNEYKDLGD